MPVGLAALKITLLANRDIASNLALNYLLPVLAPDHTLQVFLSSHVGGDQRQPAALASLKFYEQTLFNELLFPVLDQAGVTGDLLTFNALSRYTVGPIGELNRINTAEGLEQFRESRPDLVLSIRYGSILKDAAIAVPPLGVINLHSGRLPDYRGVMATFRALLNGDTEIGTTLHYISDGGIDNGAILQTTSMPVQREHSYLWHVLALYADGCKAVLRSVEQLVAGTRPASKPQQGNGNYYSFPGPDTLAAFHAAGWRLYDETEVTTLAKRYLETST